MEKDDEIKGNGNSYDFGARIYDSRLVRWLSLDPLASKYPSESPYIFVGNNPIFYIDPDVKFKLPSSYKDSHTNFYKFVNEQLGKFYLNSETALQVLNEFSVGQLTREKVRETTGAGYGPIVQIYNSDLQGFSGEYLFDPNDPETGTIRLDEGL